MAVATDSATEIDPRLVLQALEITPATALREEISIPGSKSYTNRAVFIAALADGDTELEHALMSEDTQLAAGAVQRYGQVEVSLDPAGERMAFHPTGASMVAPADEIVMGNAGTPIRILTAYASLGRGTSRITGNSRMQERPIQDLIDGLQQLGVPARTVRGNGCPPVEVIGARLKGGTARIRGSVSSQFTTAILLSAPYAEDAVEIEITDDLTSKPYVDMTLQIMREFGVQTEREGYRRFRVGAGQRYRGQPYRIEPDASNMSYFLAAAAISGGRIRVPGIGRRSVQGDLRFLQVLEQMGCSSRAEEDSVELLGGRLRGIDVDMNWMPDLVPTLAAVAAFADGRTRITNIGNLRIKECDRIAAMEAELAKVGVRAESTKDTLTVHGGKPLGAQIETYNDHRIAMSFAIIGLFTPHMVIRNPGCVSKSCPTFWQLLDGLRS
ncbi:MAG: 3-phosphoshikimate 1-carboxyvinyltransferase [Chloroflexi bacterium]|nr:MAG: 3-phosphoshikimate 1-carboxyvinyltransferase [Chloroflexota bacterium]